MSAHIPANASARTFWSIRAINDIISAIRPRQRRFDGGNRPRPGRLPEPLMKSLNHLHCVEIDRDIIARLHKTYSPGQVDGARHRCAEIRFRHMGDKLRIVGNLPYNISTPLLFHLAEYGERIHDMHFMLQKEVVERMVAEPSTPDYGRLSVMLQYRFVMDKVLDVPPEAFNPPPKVDSAVVR